MPLRCKKIPDKGFMVYDLEFRTSIGTLNAFVYDKQAASPCRIVGFRV